MKAKKWSIKGHQADKAMVQATARNSTAADIASGRECNLRGDKTSYAVTEQYEIQIWSLLRR
jgi:hypothetical protein